MITIVRLGTQALNVFLKLLFQEEIKKALDRACTIIPDRSLRRKCRESIEKRGDAIVDAILENMTAENICKILQYC